MDGRRLSCWRWGLYAASMTDSIFIPVVGGVAEKLSEWVVVLTILYVLWAIITGIFALTFFERSPRFILRCLYYLCCAILPLVFFGGLSTNADFQLWLPFSLTLGIFLGVSLGECYALLTWKRIRGSLLKTLGATGPVLPQYRNVPLPVTRSTYEPTLWATRTISPTTPSRGYTTRPWESMMTLPSLNSTPTDTTTPNTTPPHFTTTPNTTVPPTTTTPSNSSISKELRPFPDTPENPWATEVPTLSSN